MWGKMQKHCVIAGCREENTSLHSLPKDPEIKYEWLKFIYCKVPEKFSLNLTVCSAHFSADCFLNRAQYSAGFAQKLLLKDGAVPTLVEPTTKAHALPHVFQLQSSMVMEITRGDISGVELELQQNTANQHDQSLLSCFDQNLYSIHNQGGNLIPKQLLSRAFKDCVCCVCGEHFAVQDELMDHFKTHKGKVRCHLCQAMFAHVISLALHLENAHSRNQLFCHSCRLTFSTIWHMNGHMGTHLQKNRTMEVHMESTRHLLMEEDILHEVNIGNVEARTRNLKEEEEEVIIHCVKEEEEEVIIENKEAELSTLKEEELEVFIANEQVVVKCEQELPNYKEAEIKDMNKEEEADMVKVEELEENITELPELDRMVWFHDHTYFSMHHHFANPVLSEHYKDITDNVPITSREIPKYLHTECDQQGTSQDDLSVYGSLHDHNYFTQSPASPIVTESTYAYNTRSCMRKTANIDINPYSNELLVYNNNKENTRIFPKDSPVDGQGVCSVFLDHKYLSTQHTANPAVSKQVPTQTTCRFPRITTNDIINPSSESVTQGDQQVIPESELVLSSSLCGPEGEQEKVEEYVVGIDEEQKSLLLLDNLKNKPLDNLSSGEHPPDFDFETSPEDFQRLHCKSNRWKGRVLVQNQACKDTNQKLLRSVTNLSENLELCPCCALSKVPNSEKPMQMCTCTLSLTCSLCKEAFGTQQLLMKHQTEIHPFAKYLCACCLQLLPNQETFIKHICSTSKILSGEVQNLNEAPPLLLSQLKLPGDGQGGPSVTIVKIINAPQMVNTVSKCALPALSNNPPITATQTRPIMARRSLSCYQNQKVPVIKEDQRRGTPIYPGSQTKLGLAVSSSTAKPAPCIYVPQLLPSIGSRVPPPVQLQLNSSVSTPAQAMTFPEDYFPLLNFLTYVPSTGSSLSPDSPLKIVAMFVNQSQELDLQRRLLQSWRAKMVFSCRHCGARSRQPSLGVRHRYQHRGPRPHRCQCGRAFEKRLQLLRHQVQHAEASLYVCATCGQTFRGTQQLACHKRNTIIRVTPTNGKIRIRKMCRNNFHCYCGQTFARPATLLWHMLKNSKARKSRLK